MPKKDALALDTRRLIFEFVRRSPGTHLRGIEREVHLPFGQVLYHLDYLEKSGLLSARKDGGFKRYFVRNEVGRQEKAYISAFRHDLPRRISILLLLEPALTHREILDYFDVSGSTLSFHLNKMVESGILDRAEGLGETRYRVIEERTAAKTLILYRESFADEAVDRFAELWLAVNYAPPEERRRLAREDREITSRHRGADLAFSILRG